MNNYYQLNEKTRITADSFGWHLEKPSKNKKTGEITWIGYSHFSNFKSTINSFAEEQIRIHWANFENIIQVLTELRYKLEDIEKCFKIY